MTDYVLWEVILNGDSPPPTRSIDGVKKEYPPITAEEKLARNNELKARGTLLMALPNEHQLKFKSYKNSMSLMEVIEKRFGVSVAHGVSATNSKDKASTLQNVDSFRDGLEVADGNVNYESQKIPIEYMKESRRGHFARECKAPKHQDNRNKEAPKRTVPVKESTSNALVSQCDGLSYDSSDQAEEGPTSFTLMAYTSLGYSSSSSSDTEARLVVYKKNEEIFEENIKILKLDVMFRDNALAELRKKFEKAKKEKDDLKLTLEKFESLSKNLNKLLNSQVSNMVKTGIGYDYQGFDRQVEDETETKTKSKQRKPSFAKVKFVKPIEHVKSPRKSVKQENNNRQSKYSRKYSQSPRGNPQTELQEKGIIDSGCYRHMTRNMSYLSEYEEIDGGYVVFRGDPKRRKKSLVKNDIPDNFSVLPESRKRAEDD
nr:hypothetical protein [Tanacetum cinerariifolium]